MNSRTGKIGVVLGALLSAGGLALSGVLLQHHVAIQLGHDPLLGGVCEVTEHASCDEVLSSEWAYHLGQPTALWGFFFFAAMFAWYVCIGRPTESARGLNVIPFLAAGVGLGVVVYLAYTMYWKLPAWCPLCAGTHAITLLLFVLAGLLWPVRMRPRMVPDPSAAAPSAGTPGADARVSVPMVQVCDFPSARRWITAVLLAVWISYAGWSTYHGWTQQARAAAYYDRWREYENDNEASYVRFMTTRRVFDIPILPGDAIRGPENAPHTVVVYSDFQCEYCKGLAQHIETLHAEWPELFRVVYKYFPMNQQCNPAVTRTLHARSCEATYFAEAVRLLGGSDAFWKAHDVLFAKQSEFASNPNPVFDEAAHAAGLDPQQLRAMMNSPEVKARVQQHIEQARSMRITATPMAFFDGRWLRPWGDRHFWKYLLGLEKPREALPTATQSAPAEPVSDEVQ